MWDSGRQSPGEQRHVKRKTHTHTHRHTHKHTHTHTHTHTNTHTNTHTQRHSSGTYVTMSESHHYSQMNCCSPDSRESAAYFHITVRHLIFLIFTHIHTLLHTHS